MSYLQTKRVRFSIIDRRIVRMIWLNIGSILIDRFLGVNQIGDVHHGAIAAILWSLWPISNRSYRINSQNQDFDDGPVIRVVSVPLIFTIQT